MDFAWASLCLPVKDLEPGRAFYEAFGMEVVDAVPDVRVMLDGPR